MSISLTSSVVVTQGASTLETDNAAALMSLGVDFSLHSATADPIVVLTFKNGVVSGLSLVPGLILGNNPIQVSINLTTGAWAATTGQTGTMNGAPFTTLLNALKTLRNAFENFAVNNAIVVGTQVAW